MSNIKTAETIILNKLSKDNTNIHIDDIVDAMHEYANQFKEKPKKSIEECINRVAHDILNYFFDGDWADLDKNYIVVKLEEYTNQFKEQEVKEVVSEGLTLDQVLNDFINGFEDPFVENEMYKSEDGSQSINITWHFKQAMEYALQELAEQRIQSLTKENEELREKVDEFWKAINNFKHYVDWNEITLLYEDNRGESTTVYNEMISLLKK